MYFKEKNSKRLLKFGLIHYRSPMSNKKICNSFYLDIFLIHKRESDPNLEMSLLLFNLGLIAAKSSNKEYNKGKKKETNRIKSVRKSRVVIWSKLTKSIT
ncbi:hypothetical protein BpHYR1_026570 [Brachionus plicatilis]|uniref:Uncharacterized protein n=1 Tax=Brachionus plicatilis TaxID=10195 RepID=A0A3M7PF60_BRAPC|nr:hypothetical protein BpHYR1_026570 [Brachionus plicatilis]